MPEDVSQMYEQILTRDFTAFNHRAFLEVSSQTRYLPNWHLDVLSAKLEEVRLGTCKRLIIALPPRHLKSITVSVSFVAWLLGHDPAAQVLCVSYAQDLSDKHARDCRTLLQSPFYRSLFPTRLSQDRQAVGEFVTTEGGYRLSTSVGGVLTGRGADIIIIDDPLKADEAGSDARREYVNDWFDNALYSRLNDKENGAIIIVMQRLHEDDLVGHVMETGGWEILSFPAIAESDETHSIATPYGPRTYRRSKGDALHPERESLQTLVLLKERLGTAAFSAQYQQAPCSPEGLLVKAAWFPRYTNADLPLEFDAVVLSCDTANKITEFSDFSVCSVWGSYEDDRYLLFVLRRRMEFPELKRAIKDLARQHRTTNILIEDRASGTQLVQELHREGLQGVEAITPVGDKQMRLNAQTPCIESGFVHIPAEAPWLEDYLHELTTFPNGKYDDQVDSTSQALAWFNKSSSADGWLRYARDQLRKMGHPNYVKDVRVRLLAPRGVTSLILQNGQSISVDARGTVVVSEEDARPLKIAGWTTLS